MLQAIWGGGGVGWKMSLFLWAAASNRFPNSPSLGIPDSRRLLRMLLQDSLLLEVAGNDSKNSSSKELAIRADGL